MERYDVIVAGAGPAGSSAAALLAGSGLRVLVLDRLEFPRDKACGGGLTPRGAAALRTLGVDTDGPQFQRMAGLEMVGDRRSASVAFPSTSRWPGAGVVARRSDLDALLLQRAIAAGAEFRPHVRVLGPLMDGGTCRGVRIQANGSRHEVSATHTIAADGATSVLAREAGLSEPSGRGPGFWYAAMRGYFGPVRPRSLTSGPVLEFYPLRTPGGRWLPGYGWVFPLPDGSANVGVDLPHRPVHDATPPLREAYAGFVERLRRERPGFDEATPEAPPAGALLPEGMSGIRAGLPGLLLAGDAAGLITPYSGEGILYALESASLLRDAVLTGGVSDAHASYTRALTAAYGFHFRTALWFMKSVRRAPLAAFAAKLGIGNHRILRSAVRVMANLIEDDPTAPASTVSRLYRGGERVLQPLRLWDTGPAG